MTVKHAPMTYITLSTIYVYLTGFVFVLLLWPFIIAVVAGSWVFATSLDLWFVGQQGVVCTFTIAVKVSTLCGVGLWYGFTYCPSPDHYFRNHTTLGKSSFLHW